MNCWQRNTLEYGTKKADKRDVGRKGKSRVLYSEWTEVLTTHLNGYIQATNSSTVAIDRIPLAPTPMAFTPMVIL